MCYTIDKTKRNNENKLKELAVLSYLYCESEFSVLQKIIHPTYPLKCFLSEADKQNKRWKKQIG